MQGHGYRSMDRAVRIALKKSVSAGRMFPRVLMHTAEENLYHGIMYRTPYLFHDVDHVSARHILVFPLDSSGGEHLACVA